ncbi:MAG TPA: VIT domain-containing protein [Halomicronema sp.]
MTQFTSYSYCLNPNCQHSQNILTAENCNACGKPLLLHNKYRAIKLLGSGGFGRTFLAIDTSKDSQNRCVIKQFFPKSNANRQKASQLFRQEAEQLKKLASLPQVPDFLDYFEEGEEQYLLQEYIAGKNLGKELEEEGTFDEIKIRQVLNELLPVLNNIHKENLIHRDIKPENIIRQSSTKNLVLVDFGAAKFATETSLAKTGTMIGSAAYIAPEQTRGKATFASDIYSLGVTCIHLMTNIPTFDLFDGVDDRWIWRQYLAKPVSSQLGNVLDKMLESALKKRYQTALEAFIDLNENTSPLAKSKTKIVAGSAALLLFGWMGFNVVGSFLQQNQAPVSSLAENTNNLESFSEPLGVGGLFANQKGQQKSFPLLRTDVKTKISGNVSRVEVKQSFANPYKTPLEAVYTFPLPDEAAVDDMEIRIGDRVIKGVIKKREEAKQIFEKAKQEGKTAGLLEQERDNIFTQSLANIKPGEKIEVVIRYTDSLKFEGGDYEFAFPMVVGPRYIPGSKINPQGDTNQVADASKITPPMLPETRSGQDITMAVEIDAGVPIVEVKSPSHKLLIDKSGSSEAEIKLAQDKTIPNKDFILRYKVAGAETQATILTQKDEKGGHFGVYLIPALKYNPQEIVPKDVVFLMDTSGSQAGAAIEQSKELMRRFISGLNAKDTFTIIDFASTSTKLSAEPLKNTPANRAKALAYVNRLSANGGSELMAGINEVLNFPPAPDGRLRSIVLLTDGLIGDDMQIIGEVQKRLKPGNRLYTFGVGPSSNRFILNRLAELGRGKSVILPPEEPAQKVAANFFRDLNNPVLTNIEVSWVGEGKKPIVYPLQAADLFANQPLVLFGKKEDRKNGQLKVTGTMAGGKRYENVLNVNFDQVSGNSGIAQLWGRARIKELMNQLYGGENATLVKMVTDTALEYRLMSNYTAFVAVSEEVRVDPKNPKLTQQVPVNLPQGMQLMPIHAPGSAGSVPEGSSILTNIIVVLMLGVYWFYKRRLGSKNINDQFPPVSGDK